MDEPTSALQFPCDFPIKVFAAADSDLLGPARAIVERHAGELPDERIAQRASKHAKYVAITFTITAESREQLDDIYRELSAHDDVLMAL